MRYLLQTARADSVHPFLIFLNLLECYSKLVGKRLLRHPEHQSAHANTAANVEIRGILTVSSH